MTDPLTWTERLIRDLRRAARHPADAAGLIAAFGLSLAVAAVAIHGGRELAPAAAVPAPSQVAGPSAPAAASAVVELAATPHEIPRAAAPPPPDKLLVLVTTEGEIGRGQTLAGSLSANGVGSSVTHAITTGMSPVFNFRYARPGDRYKLVQDQAGELVRFRYVRSPLEQYTLRRVGDEYRAERHEPDMVRRQARVAGVVTSSLYDAVGSLGEDPALAHDFAEIFAWDVDFTRAVQPGDEFSILYERLNVQAEDGSLRYVRPGRILAARYSNAADDYTAVYFETEEGQGGYYRPDGSSVQRQFLKAPLNYRRISSRYTLSRLHPILKVRRPHQGIDYAAAPGTPVWSVGNGTVIFRGWAGGFGRLVKVRHANGYVSYYGHLQGFADGLRVGSAVRQKQVVGYVGSSGLATGPHLDFRLQRNGRYVNPASLETPAGPPIPAEMLASFASLRDDRLASLDPTPLPVATNEAL